MTEELSPYVDRAMYEAEPMETIVPQVTLLSATPDPLGSIAAMAKIYKGEVVRDIDELTEDERRHYWDELTKTHLKAPWESVDFHFLIEGVTRAFTHQNGQTTHSRVRTGVAEVRGQGRDRGSARSPGGVGPGRSGRLGGRHRAGLGRLPRADRQRRPRGGGQGLLPHDTLTRLHYKTNLRNPGGPPRQPALHPGSVRVADGGGSDQGGHRGVQPGLPGPSSAGLAVQVHRGVGHLQAGLLRGRPLSVHR